MHLFVGGVIVIILNYTGDLLNFGLAMEMARDYGIKVSRLLQVLYVLPMHVNMCVCVCVWHESKARNLIN